MSSKTFNIDGHMLFGKNGRPGFMALSNILSQKQLNYDQSDVIISENQFLVKKNTENNQQIKTLDITEETLSYNGAPNVTHVEGALNLQGKSYKDLCASYSILSRDSAKTSIQNFEINKTRNLDCYITLNEETLGFAGFLAYGEVISVLSQIDLPIQRMIQRIAKAEFDEFSESTCFLISLDMPNHPPLKMVRDAEQCYVKLLQKIFTDIPTLEKELEQVSKELKGEKQLRTLYRYETTFLTLYDKELTRIEEEKERIYKENNKEEKNENENEKTKNEMDEMDLYFARLGIFNKNNEKNNTEKEKEKAKIVIPNRIGLCILPIFMRTISSLPGIVIPVFPNQPVILLNGDFAYASYDTLPENAVLNKEDCNIEDETLKFINEIDFSVITLMGSSTSSVLYKDSIDSENYIQVLFTKRGERLNIDAREMHDQELMYGDDKYERMVLARAEKAGEEAIKSQLNGDEAAKRAAKEEQERIEKLKKENSPEAIAKKDEETKRITVTPFKTFDIYTVKIPFSSFNGDNCIDDTITTILENNKKPSTNCGKDEFSCFKKTPIDVTKYIARGTLMYVPLMSQRFNTSLEVLLEYANYGKVNKNNIENIRDYNTCMIHYMYGQATIDYKNILIPAINIIHNNLKNYKINFSPLNSLASDNSPSLLVIGAWKN